MNARNAHQWTTENALGNGNCAFNAFALGLAEKKMLDAIEHMLQKPPLQLIDLIKAIAEKLHIEPVWEKIKGMLILLKKNHPIKLQQLLAPILREFATTLIAQNKDSQYEGRTEALLADFSNYFSNRFLYTALDRDDIYLIDFIVKKYREFSRDYLTTRPAFANRAEEPALLENAVKEYQGQLRQWWDNEGYHQFLIQMSRNGSWAGDLELVPLCKFFNIDLYVKKEEFGPDPVAIHCNRGHVLAADSKLEEGCIQELIARDIIEAPNTSVANMLRENSLLQWKPMTESKLNSLLSEVQDIKRITEHLENEPVKTENVKNELCTNKELMHQLKQRGIVTRQEDCWTYAHDYSKKPARDIALRRIAACPQRENVLLLWKASYQRAPVMVLENKDNAHWNHLKRCTRYKSARVGFFYHRIRGIPTTYIVPAPKRRRVTF